MYSIHYSDLQEIAMKRTQLYLDEKTLKSLSLISKQQQKSVSELVRVAILKTYGLEKAKDPKTALLKAFGIWKDRTDIKDTEDYARKIRKGKRIEKLWGDQ